MPAIKPIPKKAKSVMGNVVERPKSPDEIVDRLWEKALGRKKLSPFQRDVRLAKQPTKGAVVRGFDPTRLDEKVMLDYGALAGAKDYYEGLQGEEARHLGLTPDEYRGLFDKGIFDKGADPDEIRAAVGSIVNDYSKYTNYGKVEIPHKITTAVRMIADAYRVGGEPAARKMRERLDAASGAYADSLHNVTDEERAEIESAKRRVVRDHVLVAPYAGELNFARGLLNMAGLPTDSLDPTSRDLNDQLQDAKPIMNEMGTAGKVAVGAVESLPAMARMLLLSQAAPAGAISQTLTGVAQGLAANPDASWEERRIEGLKTGLMMGVGGKAAELTGAMESAAARVALGAGAEGAANVALDVALNPETDTASKILAGLQGAVFGGMQGVARAHEVVRNPKSDGLYLPSTEGADGGHLILNTKAIDAINEAHPGIDLSKPISNETLAKAGDSLRELANNPALAAAERNQYRALAGNLDAAINANPNDTRIINGSELKLAAMDGTPEEAQARQMLEQKLKQDTEVSQKANQIIEDLRAAEEAGLEAPPPPPTDGEAIASEGSLTINPLNKRKDAGPLSWIGSPLSSPHFKGRLERVGGALGKKVSDLFTETHRLEQDLDKHYSFRIDTIDALLKKARNEKVTYDPVANAVSVDPKGLATRIKNKVSRSAQRTFEENFVDLIERPRIDPERRAIKDSDTNLGRALQMHDEMTERFRQVVLDRYLYAGEPRPANWGISDTGYFRHMFFGDFAIKVDGLTRATARDYAEAQVLAKRIYDENPGSDVVAEGRLQNFPSGADGKYWKLLSGIKDLAGKIDADGKVEIKAKDVLADLDGVTEGAKNKWPTFLLHRMGAEGYSKAYMDIMNVHKHQMVKMQTLPQLESELRPYIVAAQRLDQNNLANLMNSRMQQIWGTPTRFEKIVGNAVDGRISQMTGIDPAMALRKMAQGLTSFNSLTRLKYNPRSATVNLFDTIATMWPYTNIGNLAKLTLQAEMPSVERLMVQRGVLDARPEVANDGSVTQVLDRKGGLFGMASRHNRKVGYLFGLQEAERQGMLPNTWEAHKLALDWAGKVEFESSRYHTPQILNNPTGKVLGQFKSYTIKSVENVASAYNSGAKDNRLKGVYRGMKAAAGQGVVGGLSVATKPLVALGLIGTYNVAAGLQGALKEGGMNEDDAALWAERLTYGAPHLVGLSLTGSLGLGDEFMGDGAAEKAANYLGGPTLGTLAVALDKLGPVAEEVKNLASDPSLDQLGIVADKATTAAGEIATKATPYARAVKSVYAAINQEPVTIKGADGEKRELGLYDAVMYSLGFTPLEQQTDWDVKNSGLLEPKAEAVARRPVDNEIERLGAAQPQVGRTFKVGKDEKYRLEDRFYVPYKRDQINDVYQGMKQLLEDEFYKGLADPEKKEVLNQFQTKILGWRHDLMQAKLNRDILKQVELESNKPSPDDVILELSIDHVLKAPDKEIEDLIDSFVREEKPKPKGRIPSLPRRDYMGQLDK